MALQEEEFFTQKARFEPSGKEAFECVGTENPMAKRQAGVGRMKYPARGTPVLLSPKREHKRRRRINDAL